MAAFYSASSQGLITLVRDVKWKNLIRPWAGGYKVKCSKNTNLHSGSQILQRFPPPHRRYSPSHRVHGSVDTAATSNFIRSDQPPACSLRGQLRDLEKLLQDVSSQLKTLQ